MHVYIHCFFLITLGLTEDQPQEEYKYTPVDVDFEKPEQPSNELWEEVTLLEETLLLGVLGMC